jgi:hypothetical protein
VEAMILHAASFAAFFVDQLAQAPVQIQCVQQASSESWVKWLLQFALSIIPVAGGVWIAWMAFRWNTKKEHQRWVFDQKKAEWREILDAIKECEDYLLLTDTSINREEIEAGLKYEALQRTRKVQQLFYDRLFVDRYALGQVLSRWNDVNKMICAEENGPSMEYTSAYIGLVDFTRRAARKDLGVPD